MENKHTLDGKTYKKLKKQQKTCIIIFLVFLVIGIVFLCFLNTLYELLWYDDLEWILFAIEYVIVIPIATSLIIFIIKASKTSKHERYQSNILKLKTVVKMKELIIEKCKALKISVDNFSLNECVSAFSGECIYAYSKYVLITPFNLGVINKLAELELDKILIDNNLSYYLSKFKENIEEEKEIIVGLIDDIISWIDAYEVRRGPTTSKMSATNYLITREIAGADVAMIKYLETEKQREKEASRVDYYISIKRKNASTLTSTIYSGRKLLMMFPNKCSSKIEKYLILLGK